MLSHKELVDKLNSIRFWKLENIRVGNVLWLPSWNFQAWDAHKKVSLSYNRIRMSKNVADTAFFISNYYYFRKDHLARFKEVVNIADNKKIVVESGKKVSHKLNADMIRIVIWYLQMMRLDIPIRVRWILCCNLYELYYTAHKVSAELVRAKTKCLVVFSDAAALDNLLVQMCNNAGMKTITLQHGIINGIYDYVEYKASESKKFLAWGRYTYDMGCALGMSPDKLEIVGNISLPDRKGCRIFGVRKKFLVALGGNTGKEEWKNNCELLKLAREIAEQYSMEYIVRFHPNDRKEKYNAILHTGRRWRISEPKENLYSVFDEIDYILCGNTTIFVEGLYYSIPSMRYINKALEKVDVCKGIQWGCICSKDDFMEYYSRMDSEDYRQEMRKIVEYMFEDADCTETYRKAIMGNRTEVERN